MNDVEGRKADPAAVTQILDRIHGAFYALDVDWRFTAINRAAEEYLGRAREELIGERLWDLFPKLLGTQIEDEYRAALSSQRDREFEMLTPIYRRWVEVRVFPSPEGISVFFLDVTARKQAQDALQASETKYRALFEHMLDGVQLTSPDGRVLESNPAACHMLQRTSQEITALGRAGIVDTSDPRLASLLEQRRLHGHVRGELTFLRKDGTRFPAEVSSAIFTDADDNVRTSLTFRDLTEAKRSETALRLLADASAVLQASLDLDTVLDNLASLLAPAIADLAVIDIVEGATFRRIVARSRADADARVEILRASVPGPPSERGVSHVLRTREPELVPVVTDDWLRRAARDDVHLAAARALAPTSMLMVPMIARGELLGVLSLSYLDGRRRYDERDLPLARGLADRAALAIDNARLYAAAVAARKHRDEMLGVVSHDLRTPLHSIALRAQILARHQPALDVAPILRSVAQADRLVQDLLTISAIESGTLPLERADEELPGMLAEVLDLHRAIADQREITLKLDCPRDLGGVHVDRHRFMQALANLVANGVKFTPPGGSVELRAMRGAAGTTIEVSDTGIGISGDLDRLFDRFWRGRHGRDGVGLGLAITKGVIEAHGGHVAVRTEVGAGTTFTIVLPDQVRSTSPSRAPDVPAGDGAQQPRP